MPSRTQSILAKAFRGELVPQDEMGEPAAVLFERIKAESEEKAETIKSQNMQAKKSKAKTKNAGQK